MKPLYLSLFLALGLGALLQGQDSIAPVQIPKRIDSARLDSLRLKLRFNRTHTPAKTALKETVVYPPSSVPSDNDVEAAQASGISALRDTGYLLDGQGLLITAWESGMPKDHLEFDTRLRRTDPNGRTSQHAVWVAGVLIASGQNPAAKGMAPQANLESYSFYNDSGSGYNDFYIEFADRLSNVDTLSVVSNHSWGYGTGYYQSGNTWYWNGTPAISTQEDYIFGYYSQQDQTIDNLLYAAPYHTMIVSSGNENGQGPTDNAYPLDCASGYDCIQWGTGSKNQLTVGATLSFNEYTQASDVQLLPISAVGPTDDGRIKPDVVAVGGSFLTTDLDNKYTDGSSTYSGTSFSTPVVTGGAALIQQYFNEQWATYMLGYTLKGLITHTADEAGDQPGPDYRYGWGFFDAKQAVDFIDSLGYTTYLTESVLNQNQSHIYYFRSQQQPLKATLVWYDPAGTPLPYDGTNAAAVLNNRTSKLINDLDVRVIQETQTYLPWKLDPDQPFQAATKGDNTVDTVEQLYTDGLANGVFKLIVSHKGQLQDPSQDYALIVSGAENTCNVYENGTWSKGLPTAHEACLYILDDYTITQDTTFDTPWLEVAPNINLTIDQGVNFALRNGTLKVLGNVYIKPSAAVDITP